VDLSFESNNSSRENNSLCKQLSLSYSVLKKELAPISFHLLFSNGNPDISSLVSSGSCSRPVAYESLRLQGVDNWVVTQHWESLLEAFPTDQIVYLSPDASEVLSDADFNSVKSLQLNIIIG
jgi:Trm5-related predicted tRNA methylase